MAAGVKTDGRQLVVGSLVDDEAFRPVLSSSAQDPGNGLSAPSWDGLNDLWVADRNPAVSRLYVLRDGTGAPRQVQVPKLAGRIEALRVASDGVRIALVVKESGVKTLQLGLIENLQRADLTPIDEALAYRRLQQDFDQSHDDIARTVGKSRPHVANTVRLLELPDPVQAMVRGGALSAGQARALIGVPDPLAMAQRALGEKLTVRELERLGGDLKRKTRNGAPKTEAPKSADTRALEKRIEEALGLKANLKLRGLGEQSLLTLEIRDFDQLDSVVDRLTRR